MIDLEHFLVNYATYHWQSLLSDITADWRILFAISITFGIIFLNIYLFFSNKNKHKISKLTQTDEDFSQSYYKVATLDYGDFLLNYIINQNLCSSHILSSWVSSFNDFTISKKCQITNFNKDQGEDFKCSEVLKVENKEIFSFTFRMKCEKIIFTVSLNVNAGVHKTVNIIIKDFEIMALAIVRVSAQGLLVKFCPERVCGLNCELISEDINSSEREMSVTEFKRDFKLIVLQTIEMEWGSQMKPSQSKDEVGQVNEGCQVDLTTSDNNKSQSITNGDSSESADITDFMEAEEYHNVTEEVTPRNQTLEHNFEEANVKKLMSQASLFTTGSYDYYEHGEESPFHDRFSSKLIGRTLVVALVKIIEAQELRVPLKKGYCVLELDEPYQRHVSHLISMAEYPVWNQHFIFSLNSNSQRISVELFQASKKCQNPIPLGISLIPISVIIVGQTENIFPINVNQFGSRTSWRCDNVAGAPDSKIPAFVIEFQIMKSAQEPFKPYLEASSQKSSNSGIFVANELAGKYSDSNDPISDNSNKMQTIPEFQLSSNGKVQMIPEKSKVLLRSKLNDDDHRSKSVISKLKNRISQLSSSWTTEKSKSDDCLDHCSSEEVSKHDLNYVVPIQPPTELFMTGAKSKLTSKNTEVELIHSHGLSSSFKKMLSFPTKKFTKNDQYMDKSLDHLFKEMDPKLFDTISKEGFDRIMHDDGFTH